MGSLIDEARDTVKNRGRRPRASGQSAPSSTAENNGHTRRERDSLERRPASQLVQGLGYFSLALGTTQLAAPGLVNVLIGVRDDSTSRRWQRLVGLQELSAAGGILSQQRPTPWLWARTGGDVMHLAMLARARRRRCESAARITFAMASVVGCFVADAFASVRLSLDRDLVQKGQDMTGHATITVRAQREELADRWRSFEQQDDAARLGPIEILSGDATSGIRWRTLDAGGVRASGVTRFRPAPGERGNEIHVDVEFEMPGGSLGAALKKVIGDEPLQLVEDDLRRLKQLVETGEIARSDGALTGISAKAQPKQRPAQPPAQVPA